MYGVLCGVLTDSVEGVHLKWFAVINQCVAEVVFGSYYPTQPSHPRYLVNALKMFFLP
jgi:hypothetical protein